MGIFDSIKKALGIDDESNQPPVQPLKTIDASSSNEHAEFDAVVKQSAVEHRNTSGYFYNIKVANLNTYVKTVKLWDDKKRVRFLVNCCGAIHRQSMRIGSSAYNSPEENEKTMRLAYVHQLLKAKLVMDDEDIALISKTFCEKNVHKMHYIAFWPVGLLLNQISTQRKGQILTQNLQTSLKKIQQKLVDTEGYQEKERIKLIEKIDTILFGGTGGEIAVKPTKFLGEDTFSPYANDYLAQLPDSDKPVWYRIITLAQTASGSKPSTKYLDSSKALFKEIGAEKFKRVVIDWFTFVVQLKEKETQHSEAFGGHVYNYSTYEFLSAVNIEAIKGCVWMCANFHDTHTLQSISKLAERCFKKIPSVGSASVAIGNACLFVLFKSKGLEGISHLSRLKLRVKQNSTQTLIDKYLAEAAKAQGISITEIEDLAVDEHGLVNGKRSWTLDDYTFELQVIAPGKVQQQWIKPDGTPQKSEPAAIKAAHAAKLKKIKAIVKQVEQSSTTQRDRIDLMLRTGRTMQWAYFQQYYFQHGLIACLAKKIIWRFEAAGKIQTAIWSQNGWVNAQEMPVEIAENSTVSLWHPAIASLDETRTWRTFLMNHQLQQPLKQAFREVYLLTEAEMNTRTYSNRMAAHVLKQHQFNSLAKGRGWKYALRGGFDSATNPMASLALPAHDLVAEYWINDVNAEGTMNATGIWDYIVTDQVRFVQASTSRVVELIDVPPIPFSEVMRDVDLFVGVASVGNDPTWRDSGGVPGYNDYWQSYSFGNLSELAKTRKEILVGLLPRLKLKNIAHIDGNFLVVKGKLRTYKIHIGSSNILMEPNDQYLCIVPDRGSAKTGTDNVFLPFEGDGGLSVVLSKAFLLADDDKITDSSITSQIQRQ